MAETTGTPSATLNKGNVATAVNELPAPRIIMLPTTPSSPTAPVVTPKLRQIRRATTNLRPHTVAAVVKPRKQ